MKPIHSPLREKSFFRKVSNNRLKRFFEFHKVLEDIEWDERSEADVEDIYEAYENLPVEVKEKVAGDLENLNDLASQRGMPCLIDAAGRCGVDCTDMTPHDLAVTLFLEDREAFKAAHNWWTIDHFQGYTDFRGREALAIDDPEAGRPQLEAAFSDFLGSQERGINIQLDIYKDTSKLAYVVCHEDYVKPVERFRGRRLVVEKDRPVFYATMVYYPGLGKLKVKAMKGELSEFARDAFAEHILGNRSFFRHQDVCLIYDLDRFKQAWRFETDPADGIEWVQVVGIRFRPEPNTKDSVEVKSYTDLIRRLDDMNIDLTKGEIERVSLCFKFPGKGRSGRRTVNLSMPNHNNLGDSKNDQMIEKYLVEWEIANM